MTTEIWQFPGLILAAQVDALKIDWRILYYQLNHTGTCEAMQFHSTRVIGKREGQLSGSYDRRYRNRTTAQIEKGASPRLLADWPQIMLEKDLVARKSSS